jgi:predicted dehydrogenase
LIELADSLGLHLVEVDAYQRHRQFIWLMDELRQRCRAGSRLVSCRANFSIPHRHATDFRYSDALGGGALLDLGYYPLSAMVALLGKPISLSANAYFEPRLRVDLSGATAMHYDGFSAFASWALGAVYDSSIEISLSDCTILARRAFAKPSDFPSEVEVVEQKENQSKSACIAIGEDDQFGKLLSDVWSQIASSDDVSRKDHYAKALGRSWVIDEVSRQIRSGSSRL